jgi:hypothetical protein
MASTQKQNLFPDSRSDADYFSRNDRM